jgi:hypothetical protein
VSRLKQMQRNIKKTSTQPVHTPKETSQSTEMPNSQQKSINRFMEACENARKKTSELPKYRILPKMPDNYPLPKLLTENGLAWEKCTTKSTSAYFPPHLTYETKIYLTILNPSRLQIAHASFDEFWTELKQISQAYCKVLITMDFIEYIELVQGKKRKLLQELTEIASDFPNVLVLPIDSVNDLQYIVIPMIKKQMNE